MCPSSRYTKNSGKEGRQGGMGTGRNVGRERVFRLGDTAIPKLSLSTLFILRAPRQLIPMLATRTSGKPTVSNCTILAPWNTTQKTTHSGSPPPVVSSLCPALMSISQPILLYFRTYILCTYFPRQKGCPTKTNLG